jgi:hypothetical protein
MRRVSGTLGRDDTADAPVVTGAPTRPAAFGAMLSEESFGATTASVTSLVVHATDVFDRTDYRRCGTHRTLSCAATICDELADAVCRIQIARGGDGRCRMWNYAVGSLPLAAV